MQILITGITGRIGSNLATALLKKGHKIRGLVWPKDPRIEKLSELDIELHYGSLTEPEDVQKAINGVEVVYHLGAAFQGGGPFSETDYFNINIGGTFNMLEAAKKENHLRQFLFASTDAIYHKYPPNGMSEPIREDYISREPQGWYALSKSVGEELCLGYWRTYTLPVTILRFCLVVGAGEILDFSQFYLSNLKSRPEFTPLWKGKEQLILLKDRDGRSYKKHIADVRDIVYGCYCALERKESVGETFQLAGPKPFTWAEVIPYLSNRLDIPYIEVSSSDTPTFYEFNLSKAYKILNFQPQYDIVRMIEDAISFRNGTDIGILPTN